MPNKKPKREVVLEEVVRTFNGLVRDRNFMGAREYLQRQPERVKRAIIYDSCGWYGALKCSSL